METQLRSTLTSCLLQEHDDLSTGAAGIKDINGDFPDKCYLSARRALDTPERYILAIAKVDGCVLQSKLRQAEDTGVGWGWLLAVFQTPGTGRTSQPRSGLITQCRALLFFALVCSKTHQACS